MTESSDRPILSALQARTMAKFPLVLRRAKSPRYLRGFVGGRFMWCMRREDAQRFALDMGYIAGIVGRMSDKVKAVYAETGAELT